MGETELVNKILKEYRKRGYYAVKIHGSAMQPKTIDILACVHSFFLGIEVKDGFDKSPTPIQLENMRLIERAGGFSACVHDFEEAIEALDNIIDTIDT